VLHLHDISRLNHCFDFGPTVNPSLRQGRQAHASAANTAITRVLYTAHRGAAHTASRPSCSDLSRVQLPFHTLPPPISCRSRRTRTHVCKPSRASGISISMCLRMSAGQGQTGQCCDATLYLCHGHDENGSSGRHRRLPSGVAVEPLREDFIQCIMPSSHPEHPDRREMRGLPCPRTACRMAAL
jgi:hypothetical protein